MHVLQDIGTPRGKGGVIFLSAGGAIQTFFKRGEAFVLNYWGRGARLKDSFKAPKIFSFLQKVIFRMRK